VNYAKTMLYTAKVLLPWYLALWAIGTLIYSVFGLFWPHEVGHSTLGGAALESLNDTIWYYLGAAFAVPLVIAIRRWREQKERLTNSIQDVIPANWPVTQKEILEAIYGRGQK